MRCIKDGCLNQLSEFLKFVGRITAYNFVKINIITHNYSYYMIVKLRLRYEYPMALILHKYKQDALETVA